MDDAARIRAVKQVFREAQALDTIARNAFLDDRCADDPTMRAEVEALLADDQDWTVEPTRSFERLAANELLDHPGGYASGDRIGNYVVRQPLGEGGFGAVYQADQIEPVRRAVALKVIKPGMDSRSVVARFEAERQALALMDHPSVAKVYEGGVTPEGRPFFAMELVKGVPINEHCDRLKLTLNQRIELFIRVCEAVQHAHTKGVIHRDLKPNNILVEYEDGTSTPKVIDFGVAKALNQRLTEATIFTEHGQLIGTPEYMSPEQAEMGAQDVDTRSDVYALGVILYELLTGLRPFESESLRSQGITGIQRMIRDVDPPKPSTRIGEMASKTGAADSTEQIAGARKIEPKSLQTALKKDLDWIVMKCLEKDRERRYDTAIAVAAELRRFLSNEPVLAGPPSVRYRTAKFVRRHRPLVATIATVLVVLVGGIVATSLALAWALRERRAAEQFAQQAEVEAAIATAVNDFLNHDLLAAVDPSRTDNRDITMREVLDIASDSIEGRFLDQPLVEASVRDTLATTYERLGDPKNGEPHRRRTVSIYTRELGDEHDDTIAAQHVLGTNLMDQGRFDEAIDITKQELEILRRTKEPDDPAILMALNNLAGGYFETGRLAEAAPILTESLASKRRTLGDDHRSTLTSIHNLAGLNLQLGNHDAAIELYREALNGRRRIFGDEDPITVRTIGSLGWALSSAGRLDEAQSLLERALGPARQRLGTGHPATLGLLNSLAANANRAGDFVGAESYFRDVHAQRAEQLGPDHTRTLASQINLANAIASQGRFADARPVYEAAIAGERRVHDPMSYELGRSLLRYTRCLIGLQAFEPAETAALEGHSLIRTTFGDAHTDTIDAADVVATLYEAWDEAQPGRGYDAKAKRWRSTPGGE